MHPTTEETIELGLNDQGTENPAFGVSDVLSLSALKFPDWFSFFFRHTGQSWLIFFGVIRLQLCHKDKWKTYNNTESLLLQRFWQCCMFAYISRLKLKRATVWYSFNTALRAKCKLLWNVKSAKGACVAQKEWYVSGADSMAVCVEMVKKKGLDCMWCSSVHSWL